jgi:hypothetical protein
VILIFSLRSLRLRERNTNVSGWALNSLSASVKGISCSLV